MLSRTAKSKPIYSYTDVKLLRQKVLHVHEFIPCQVMYSLHNQLYNVSQIL